MKKISVLVGSNDAQGALRDVRKLGIVHVEHTQVPQGKDIMSVQEDIALLDSCLDAFTRIGAVSHELCQDIGNPADWRVEAKRIIEFWRRFDQLEAFSQTLRHTISEWERWGDFSPESIRALAQQGVYIGLFEVPTKEVQRFPKDACVVKVFGSGGITRCAVIARKPVDIPPFKELPLPRLGLAAMRERLAHDVSVMESLRQQARKDTCFYESFSATRKQLFQELEFYRALSGMGSSGEIVFLTGYIPATDAQPLKDEAKRRQWGLLVAEPVEEDAVPTLVKAPRWARLAAPVFKLIEVVPGYRELDISPVFLVFFSIFFGILIGDAGYGTAYAVLTSVVFFKRRRLVQDKTVFFLFYLLSFCAIIWGLLTGTFFGQEWVLKSGFKPLAPALNDTKNMQAFCFFLGALHLSVAHGWRALLKAPALYALADIGWICVLWCAFFLAKVLILGEVLPVFWKPLFIAGVSLVVFFTNPSRNVFKAVGEGMATLALSLMNNFTDVVSYVRLFAVGLAGVAIADAFNTMAAGVGFSSVTAGILSVFIVVVGHALGVILGPISVLVHGVRLNVLEFAGHANVSWSGTAYRPLKE